MIELFLLCPSLRTHERAQDFAVKLRQAHAPARVLMSGTMHKHTLKGTGHAGFILLEWASVVPDSFLQYLDRDTTIYGYAVYPATRTTTSTPEE